MHAKHMCGVCIVVVLLLSPACRSRQSVQSRVSIDPLASFPAEAGALSRLLEIDRMAVYTLENANRLADPKKLGEGHVVVQSMRGLDPQRLSGLSDIVLPIRGDEFTAHYDRVRTYDGLIEAFVKDTEPDRFAAEVTDLTAFHEIFNWKYEFRKKKYAQAFVYKKVPRSVLNFEPMFPEITQKNDVKKQKIDRIVKPEDLDFVFPADNYVADRMTRAAFWFANHEKIPIDFHMGTFRDFQQSIASAGAEVVAEIEPFAQNYNKVWLVKYPERSTLTVAVSQISGEERLKHLALHLPIADISLPSAVYSGEYTVHGDPTTIKEDFLDARKRELTLWLNRLPPADVTVIGQKGAVESLFEAAEKMQRIVESGVPGAKDSEQKIIDKLKQRFAETGTFFHTDLVADARNVFKNHFKDAERADYKDGEMENNMFSMADLLYIEKGTGARKRLRVFSNVWGDEIIPIAEAIADNDHTQKAKKARFVYIGTAGGIPDKDGELSVQVGDLVIGRTFYDEDLNEKTKEPDGGADPLPVQTTWKTGRVHDNAIVADVFTPLTETRSWLTRMQEKGVKAVEVETFHLAQAFNRIIREKKIDVDYSVYLLISDVVDTEHTLDAAQSSDRERARQETFEQVLREIRAEKVALDDQLNGDWTDVSRWTRDLFVRNDEAFRYHAFQVIRNSRQEFASAEAVQKFFEDSGYYDASKGRATTRLSFTNQFLEDRLVRAGEFIWILLEDDEIKANTEIAIEKGFVNGTWSPKVKPVTLTVVSKDPQTLERVESILKSYRAKFGQKADLARIEMAKAAPADSIVRRLDRFSESYYTLLDLYSEGAYVFAGFLATESSTGRLKFADADNSEPLTACPELSLFCEGDFFR